jgi:Fe-S cluster assembly ATP-binding protein
MHTGEVHVIMGPNGSGKSTLAHALAGHPGYKVLDGSVQIDGVELLTMSPTDRARHGLLLAMQQPMEVPGCVRSTSWSPPASIRRTFVRE